MYALIFQGRTLARGSQERMRQERTTTATFHGRPTNAYKIERVS